MNTNANLASDRELVLSRVIDATPARLFKAWTSQLPQWWGPH
ncbi:MAG: polyketide cyclase, partial [Opitutus sp.]